MNLNSYLESCRQSRLLSWLQNRSRKSRKMTNPVQNKIIFVFVLGDRASENGKCIFDCIPTYNASLHMLYSKKVTIIISISAIKRYVYPWSRYLVSKMIKICKGNTVVTAFRKGVPPKY
jgi:hypothetical protein